MNIYNTLFILEYARSPFKMHVYKYWTLNLSKKKGNYLHRDFDFICSLSDSYKHWNIRGEKHRLIGPSCIRIDKYKYYYIRNNYYKTILYHD